MTETLRQTTTVIVRPVVAVAHSSPVSKVTAIRSTVGLPGRNGGSSSGASTEISGAQQLESNQMYLANDDSLQLLNLPLNAAVDDAIAIYGIGTGLFRITQNAGQTIRFNDSLSTMGVTGKIEATHVNSVLKLIYVGANRWLVDAAIGNFEVS